MCTLLVGYERPRPGHMLLGANRDESLIRAALPPHVLVRDPQVVAGRDSVAGGTWLGLQTGRLVAAILNRAIPQAAPGETPRWTTDSVPDRSRGLLCLDALRMDSAKQAMEWVQDEVLTCRYAPFTLFVADARNAYAAYWDGRMRIEELRPGWHVLTHVDADDPFDPRTESAHTRLRQAPPKALEDLVPTLSSHDGARSICLHADMHGTVSSSLLHVLWDDPRATRYLHAAGKPCVTPYQDFSTITTS
ncbi:MAG: NRDE family protein [Candidatus Eiseniibacteriota bacterium]